MTSNRECCFGCYDVVIKSRNVNDNAYILEFKIHKPKKEKSMEENVVNALKQIEDTQYETVLINKGIYKSRIYQYGFDFDGKNVLIG